MSIYWRLKKAKKRCMIAACLLLLIGAGSNFTTKETANTSTVNIEVTNELPASETPVPNSFITTTDDITVINNNIPYFEESDKIRTDTFENYSELDSLGRCGVAYANICSETLPTEERGEIGQVKPSGWNQAKYNCIGDENTPGYLYNRCHLIAYCLAAENANPLNLITGTEYFNKVLMLQYETLVAEYMDNNPDNHVLYRVTPVFDGTNLVASGVTMEAWSIEDSGSGICFNVYVRNYEPGIIIDYSDGSSYQE